MSSFVSAVVPLVGLLGAKKPPSPPPLPAPPPPPPPPGPGAAEVAAASEAERAKRKGAAATMLTGPGGLSDEDLHAARKMLLE